MSRIDSISPDIHCSCIAWSTNTYESINSISENDLSIRCYREKAASVPSPLCHHRETCLLERGCLVQPSNKRQDRFKNTLPEFEHLLSTEKIVSWHWRTRLYIVIVFANRTFAHLYVNSETSDVEFLFIDTSLSPKLFNNDNINSCAISDQIYAFTLASSTKLGVITFSRRLPIYFSGSKIFKMAQYSPKVSFYDLPGGSPAAGALSTSGWQISMNDEADLLVVWRGKRDSSSTTRASYNSKISHKDASNLVIFALSNTGQALQRGCIMTEGNPASFVFTDRGLQFVELLFPPTSCTLASVDVVMASEIASVNISQVSLEGNIIACKWSPNARYCAISSSCHELIIVDTGTREKLEIKTEILAEFINWHRNGLVLFLFSRKGGVQVYDVATNVLTLSLFSDNVQAVSLLELSSVFKHSIVVAGAEMCDKIELSLLEAESRSVQPITKCLLLLSRGPFIMVDFVTPKFSFRSLFDMYLKKKSYQKCKKLLMCLDQLEDTELFSYSVSNILENVLCRPIDFSLEDLTDDILALYYSASKSQKSTEVDGGSPIQYSSISTRIFHHSLRYIQCLLRTGKLEKALKVAVTVASADSCMDVYHMASDLCEDRLAAVALYHAEFFSPEDCRSAFIPKIPSDTGDSMLDEDFIENPERIASLPRIPEDGPLQPTDSVRKAFSDLNIDDENDNSEHCVDIVKPQEFHLGLL